MNNVSLNRLNAFVAVVEAGSFTAAAEQLAQSKAVVSFNIKQLEAELGVSLMTRSTRRLVLTDVGERFYRDCQEVLREAQEAIDTARKAHAGLSGTLRITTTTEYGVHAVVPALAAFARENPLLEIRHASSSQQEDLISERFDLAIRLGRLQDSSYRASLIETFDIVAVAAPDYLQRVPGKAITTPDELGRAQWLGHSRLPSPRRWPLQTPQGGRTTLEIDTPAAMIVTDSASTLRAFALQGAGVALLPEWLVRDDIHARRLRRLLPDYRFPTQSVYALYPDTRHVPEKVRAFIDFLRAAVRTPRAMKKGAP
ncbi:LysR family transcriptional regulator [Variovorax sp. PAMC26660]|uniref:LysR family transcriptional regulator n=1 Tax=Variovorax sp. PAMC26660 TaxID=2762322 RepID=UPI00164DB127|nr:LysR family transcriptional regulator [Variovorax sp. PAMC26660]QNK66521.1 LysR family transcriptional regulator [Variovorax sp. PAMC26660]